MIMMTIMTTTTMLMMKYVTVLPSNKISDKFYVYNLQLQIQFVQFLALLIFLTSFM